MDMNLQLALRFSYFRLLWKFITSTPISPVSSKNLIFFLGEKTLTLEHWLQYSFSLLSILKTHLGHSLDLGVSLSLLPGRFVAAPSLGWAASSISMLCSPPEQANVFSLLPVKKLKCCGNGNFLELQIAMKGSALVTVQQCTTCQTLGICL